MQRLLRNMKLLSAIGFTLLIVTIWFFGHAFGLSNQEQRLTAIIGVMLLWVLGLLIGRLFAIRANTLVERMFRAQLDKAVMQATPEQRGEVALLRKQLLEAIATLKKSNLGRLHGKAALYELPWYMIIGHPAAGKSSAIQNSGLVFPIAENGKNAIRGVGGTRNCDWFFTTEGVLLDTAGRYSTEREDRSEWLEFLRLLKSHRSRTPVNGIIVAISLPELSQYKSEGFAEYARQIRARINEIDQAFSRKVPIYLLFTKIDLLDGFTQFFEDLDDEQRSQVWGTTLPHDLNAAGNAAGIVSAEFEELYRGLAAIGTEKLASNRGNLNRPALFSFPIEFNSIRNAVTRFVEILFEDDPYHTHPLLRGFYFTSALQEGTPKISAGSRVSSKFGLIQSGFSNKPVLGSYSYFLRNVFRDVIFPDQHLIGRQVKSRISRTRWAGLLAGAACFSVLVGTWTWSFYNNQQLISGIESELTLFSSPTLNDGLTRLNFIQMRRDTLAKYREERRPWELSFGLYQGEKLENRLASLYADEITRLLLTPVKDKLEVRLGLLSQDPDIASKASEIVKPIPTNEEYYDLLKTYLMLQNRSRLEANYLKEQLLKYWHPLLEKQRGDESMETINPLAEHVIEYYVVNFTAPNTPNIANSPSIITDSRSYLNSALRKLSAKDRIYGEIIANASSKYPSLSLNRILDNTDVDLMTGAHTVPSAYTRAAWEGYVREAITQASRGTLKDNDWVLESNDASQQLAAEDFDKNFTDLLATYKTTYKNEWSNFIDGVSINNFRGLNDGINRLERLSDFKQSPLRRTFARIADETAWDNPARMVAAQPKEEQNIKDVIVKRLLSDSTRNADTMATHQLGELEEYFSLFGRMTAETSGSPTLVPYLGALGKVKMRLESINTSGDPGKSARALLKSTIDSSGSELVEGMQIVDGQLLAGAESNLRSTLKPMLLRPFISSYGALLPLAATDINQTWERQVFPYWQVLSDKYPFVESGTEAQLSDISKFLEAEEGALNKFLDENLGSLISREGDAYVPRRWGSMAIPFTKEFLAGISRASDIERRLFIAGGESRFELQPVPTPGLSEVVLEIDGQQLRYRNGPQIWTSFSWPTAEIGQGAKISVITFAGVSSTVASHPGRMGWIRLASEAKVAILPTGAMQLVWMMPSPDNKVGQKIAVRFNLRQVSGANPLAMNTLRELNLPKRIVN